MSTLRSSSFLKRVLLADAAVSGAVAVLQLALTSLVSRYTGFSSDLLFGTGVFLIGYVALLIGLALRERVAASLIWLVIIGNVGWALGALALSLELQVPALGVAFAVIHAAAVSVFALLEYQGLRQSSPVVAAVL